MSSLPLALLAADRGFAPDPRFGSQLPMPAQPDDLHARGWDEGYAAGCAETQRAAADALRRGGEGGRSSRRLRRAGSALALK